MGVHRKPPRAARLFLARLRSKERAPHGHLEAEARRRQTLWVEFRAGQTAAQQDLSQGYTPRHAKKEHQ